jgi:ABC-type enterobactin transport system permease subunit
MNNDLTDVNSQSLKLVRSNGFIKKIFNSNSDRRSTVFGLLFVLPLPIFLASLAIGSVPILIVDVVRVSLGGIPAKESWQDIIIQFRLPKVITAILAGAALSTKPSLIILWLVPQYWELMLERAWAWH